MDNLPDSKPSGRFESARRRLFQGAFATPAVLALHSGSALAAATSLQCVKNQVNSPILPSYQDSADIYLRVQLHALWEGVAGASTQLGWYLSGDVVEAARFGFKKVVIASDFIGAGQWKQVQLMDNGTVDTSAPVLSAQPAGNLALGSKWVALRVKPTQTKGSVEILGVVDQYTDGSAVTKSCWMSFAAGGG